MVEDRVDEIGKLLLVDVPPGLIAYATTCGPPTQNNIVIREMQADLGITLPNTHLQGATLSANDAGIPQLAATTQLHNSGSTGTQPQTELTIGFQAAHRIIVIFDAFVVAKPPEHQVENVDAEVHQDTSTGGLLTPHRTGHRRPIEDNAETQVKLVDIAKPALLQNLFGKLQRVYET